METSSAKELDRDVSPSFGRLNLTTFPRTSKTGDSHGDPERLEWKTPRRRIPFNFPDGDLVGLVKDALGDLKAGEATNELVIELLFLKGGDIGGSSPAFGRLARG